MSRTLLSILVAATTINAGAAQNYRGGAPRIPNYDQFRQRNLLQTEAERDYGRAFDQIISASRKLAKKWGEKNEGIVTALNDIYLNTSFLEQKWQSWLAANIYRKSRRDEYLEALRDNGKILKDLLDEKSDETLTRLRLVAQDMKVKADNCRHSADRLGRTIEVKVHTRGDANEVPGYEVWFVPRGLLGVEARYDRFAEQSSPTRRVLPPGVYAFWVKKSDTAGEPVTLTVGGQGETAVDIDLAVF